MQDDRRNKLAEVIVRHCTKVRHGDLVTIVGEPAALPTVEALYESVLRAGGHPSFHVKAEALQRVLLRMGTDEQVKHVSPFEEYRLERCDVLIVLSYKLGLAGAPDPARAAMLQAARRGLLTMSLRRLAEGSTRYCLTQLPSEASARDAGMTLAEHEDWVSRAGFLHLPDPVAAWGQLDEQHARMKEYLEARRELRFASPAQEQGPYPCGATNLVADISGHKWLSRAGGENFPDGELDSGPRSVDGVACFGYASYGGTLVEGVRLQFKDGRVTDASARTNENFLHRMLDMDAGSRTVGEIALGTNYALTRYTRSTFFDEKIGGTFHLALGAGYPQTGNTNESGLHWDMVGDLRAGGSVHADGELIQQNGRFLRAGWPA